MLVIVHLINRELLVHLYSPIRPNLKNIILHPIRTIDRMEQIYSEWLLFTDRFMMQEYWWLASHMQKNTTVIDLGANIGDSSIYFAQFQNVRRVIACEPSPFAYSELVKKVEKCPLKAKIKPINVAVSNYHGKTELSLFRKNVIGLNALSEGDRGGIKVRILPLATLIDKTSGPIAIKCDIEGGEELIFREPMNKRVYGVMLEWHKQPRRIAARRDLEANGFSIKKDYNVSVNGGIMCAER